MKKTAFLVFAISLSANLGIYARHHVKHTSGRANNPSCTQTATSYQNAQVTCPDGAILDVSTQATSTATASDCYSAYVSALASANSKAQIAMDRIMLVKDYICP